MQEEGEGVALLGVRRQRHQQPHPSPSVRTGGGTVATTGEEEEVGLATTAINETAMQSQEQSCISGIA